MADSTVDSEALRRKRAKKAAYMRVWNAKNRDRLNAERRSRRPIMKEKWDKSSREAHKKARSRDPEGYRRKGREKRRAWRAANPDRERETKKKARARGGPEAAKARRRASYLRYRQTHIAAAQAWSHANPERKRSSRKRQYHARKSDTEFRLALTVRKNVRRALRGERVDGSKIVYLGCSIQQLRAYIEGLFLPGMTWENWSHGGWHLDHVRPLASFRLSDPEDLRAACHYTNFQPLWAVDNLKKGSRYA